jgi:ubiquinol-cytochrome c reductase cytochrome b subunit
MDAGVTGSRARSRLLDWLDRRLPVRTFIETQLTHYYPPKNLDAWYYFGVMALVVLAIQIATGIFLAMHYKPGEATAFDSIERLMREVEWGWLIRYAHSTGASFFFIVVYLHVFRSLMYGSYRAPREVLWILGMLIYVTLMAEAFMGYVLPRGNMSYWAAQVIINLFSTILFIGSDLVEWLRGDYAVADATLSRFFSLHVIAVPLGLLLVTLHLVALRTVGSNNPEGIEIKEKLDASGRPLDGIAFHPYYIVKDVLSVGVFLLAFATVLFFTPTFGGLFLEPANFEPANSLSTPEHIAPAWYFAPYYAILRAVPNQQVGAPHAAGRGVVPVPALAGSLAGALDSLQGVDREIGAGALRAVFLRAGVPRASACRHRRSAAGPDIHSVLLRILLAHACLLAARPAGACPRADHLIISAVETRRPCPDGPMS